MNIYRKDDGIWLEVRSKSGECGMIHLSAILKDRGPIVSAAFEGWAEDWLQGHQFAKTSEEKPSIEGGVKPGQVFLTIDPAQKPNLKEEINKVIWTYAPENMTLKEADELAGRILNMIWNGGLNA